MNDSFIVYCEIFRGQIGFLSEHNLEEKKFHTSIYPNYAEVFDIDGIGAIHKMLNWLGVKHWIFQYHT